jgi:chromosome segregation protein
VTPPARLSALRLQGFKSFAERTVLELGPGINAVIGPNGAGKSNLADALRWALGEQGRALRSRKSEDVIFAGSDRRAAIGMADVTLVLDNSDGLLAVEYGTVEIGRRLYRSGENEYLLNRQRVRLRDLEDLLESAHLAENAFLFIGQGMVDQALALRPEERRPLFEEVAGVRRHDRRRRRAEEQLLEAEGNLVRVADLIAELRPQARRLAAQAEQQASRERAGDELASALLAAGHARWHDAAARAAAAEIEMDRARQDVDAGLQRLRQAEAVVADLTRRLAVRSASERERRAAHETERTRLAELRLQLAAVDAEVAAAGRDRERSDTERLAAEASLGAHRRDLALPAPARDEAIEAELAAAERARADALAEVDALHRARQAAGEAAAATRRAEEAARTERDGARRRAAEAERRAAEAQGDAAASAARVAELRTVAGRGSEALAVAVASEDRCRAARDAARAALEIAEGDRAAAVEADAAARAALAAAQGRADAIRAGIEEDMRRGIARAARRVGGRALADGLDVEPTMRLAVAAALGEAERSFVVPRAGVAELAGERGTVVIAEGSHSAPGSRRGPEPTVVARAAALGGGLLGDALRADPGGVAGRLLAATLWVPDLASAVDLAADLPHGWSVATRDGAIVTATGIASIGSRESGLERRAALGRAEAEAADTGARLEAARVSLHAADVRARDGRAAVEAARQAESVASAERRRAEDAERAAGRDLERAAREEAWHAAQAERLAAEHRRARDQLQATETVAPARAAARPDGSSGEDAAALGSWEARLAEATARRDRAAAVASEHDRARADADRRRARAEAGVALAEERLAIVDRESAALVLRTSAAEAARNRLVADLGRATAAEERARAALDELTSADAAARDELLLAEEAVGAERGRLQGAEDRHRRVGLTDVEARLALDAVREQLLVEVASLGEVGVAALRAGLAAVVGERTGGDAEDAPPAPGASDGPDPGEEIESLVEAIASRWAVDAPPSEVPSPGRLASLRRRFHDVGAANPFAVAEFAEVRVRLDGLEAQDADLRVAIERTRGLIRELETLIADRFRSTFHRLEGAFDAQFKALFGGGYAQLSLTDPADLSATGVEIVARPPGKKPQPLAMLSGGERALTAVALLFAMLQVRPVPFCVLDEVDAALDEANIGRFAEALTRLSADIQFVVITHNRGTIEAADALYGITIGDDAVSRVISLRLEDARELAASAGSGA